MKDLERGALVLVTSAIGLTAPCALASAQGAVPCYGQPDMRAALDELRRARGLLLLAEQGKGGWRIGAIEWADTAIRDVESGCAFADSH